MIELFKPHIPDNLDFSNIFASRCFSYGYFCKQFELKLTEFFKTEKLLVTNNYSSAIDLIILTLNLKPGDEIIMSPMACLVSTQPYVGHNLTIVWADIDPSTGCLNPSTVEQAITKRTKLIVHNHFCGYVGMVDEINAIGKKYNIPVLDDGIECFGSEYKGKLIGNCGTDITCFSFSPARFPNTNEGGLVIFKDDLLFKKGLLIRDCGIDRKIFRKENGEINPKCDISLPGLSAKMNEISGLLGLREMEFVHSVLFKQRANAKKWAETLKGKVEFLSNDCSKPNYWVFGVLVDNKECFIEQLRNKGFFASSVHIRNDLYSVFKSNNFSKLEGVEQFSKKFVALPCGWWINEEVIHL